LIAEQKDDTEPDVFESESSSEEPELSNVVTHTKTVILLENIFSRFK